MKLSIVWNLLTVSLVLGDNTAESLQTYLIARGELSISRRHQEKGLAKDSELSNDLNGPSPPFSERIEPAKATAEAYTASSTSWHSRAGVKELPDRLRAHSSKSYGSGYGSSAAEQENKVLRHRQTDKLSGYSFASAEYFGTGFPHSHDSTEVKLLASSGKSDHHKQDRTLDSADDSTLDSYPKHFLIPGRNSDSYRKSSPWDSQRRRTQRRALERRTTPSKPLPRISSAPDLTEKRPQRRLNAIADITNPRGRAGVLELPRLNKPPPSKVPQITKPTPNGSTSQANRNATPQSNAPVKHSQVSKPVPSQSTNPTHGPGNGLGLNSPPPALRITTSSDSKPTNHDRVNAVKTPNFSEIRPALNNAQSLQKTASFGRQSSTNSLPPRGPSDTSKEGPPRLQLPVSYSAGVQGGSPDSSHMPTPFGSIQGGSVRASIDSPPDSPRSSTGSSPNGSPRASPRANQTPTIPEHAKSNQHSPMSSPGRTYGTMSQSTSLSGIDGSGSSFPSVSRNGLSSSYPTSSTRGSPTYPSSSNQGSSSQMFRPQKSKSFTNGSPRKIDLNHQSAPPSRPLPPLERPLTRVGRVAAKIGSPILWTYKNPAKAGRIGASMTANLASGGAAIAASYRNTPAAACLAIASASLKFGIDCYDTRVGVRKWHEEEGISPHEDAAVTKKVGSALKTAPSKLVPTKLIQTVKKTVLREDKDETPEPKVLQEEWPIDKLDVKR